MAILGIDIGTTGAKAVAFNTEGKPLGSAYREYGMRSPAPGHLELDPGEVQAAIREVIGKTAAACSGDPIRSVATSTLGEAAVPVDGEGRPMGNAIIGFDSRGDQEAEQFRKRITNEEVYSITGHCINSYHTLFKAMWRQNHEKETFQQTRKLLCFGDFFISLLGLPPRIDHSMASRTLAFDIHRNQWSERILSTAGLPHHIFAPPVASGEPVGKAGKNDMGLPEDCVVAGGLHDQPAGILGAGIRPGESMLATGTVVCLGVRLHGEPEPREMVENNQCYYPTFGGGHNSLAWNFTGGSLLRWFRDQFSDTERAEAQRRGVDPYDVILGNLPEEPTRLMVLPYFTTSGTPWLDPRAMGLISGLQLTTTRSEIARAILEGLAYDVKFNAYLMEKAGIEIHLYKAIGGAAKSPIWMQIYADVLERPVAVLAVTESAALGAALLGGHAAGIYSSPAEVEEIAAGTTRVVRVFEPRPEHSRAYRERFEIYRDLYRTTRDLTHRIFGLGKAES